MLKNKYDFSHVTGHDLLLVLTSKMTVRQWIDMVDRICPDALDCSMDQFSVFMSDFNPALQQHIVEVVANFQEESLDDALRLILEKYDRI